MTAIALRRLALAFAATSLLAAIACSSSDDSSGLSVPDQDGDSGSSTTGVDAASSPGADSAAPITDAGHASDAAPDAGGGCAGKTYKICEDFESSTVGKTPTGWTVLNGYGSTPPTTVVASDAFHSGLHSIKTSSNVSGASRVQKSLSGIGATAGTHWGRIFYRVQSPAPQLSSQGPHATFVALEGNLRAGELRVVDTQQATSGKIQLLVNTPDDNCCKGTDFTYTVWDGAWHCAEWYVNSTNQSYRFFLDGTEVTALAFDYGAGSTTADMPAAFTTVAVGAIFYTPTLPSNLVTWFDDLAIDDTQIGCK
jgi:hypothetical protein